MSPTGIFSPEAGSSRVHGVEDVSFRNKTHKVSVAIHNRESADPMSAQQGDDPSHWVIGAHGVDRARHYVPSGDALQSQWSPLSIPTGIFGREA